MAYRHIAAAFALAFGTLAAQDNSVVTLPAPPPSAPGTSTVYAVPSASPGTAVQPGRAGGLLWKATSATTTVYLAGSIHFGTQDMYPLPAEFERAFEQSSVLVVEIDAGAVGASQALSLVTTLGTYPLGDSLWNHVNSRTRSGLTALAGKYGLPAMLLERLKPWAVDFMLASQMMQAEGMQPELGLDMHFLNQARGSKRIDALETPAEQIRALTSAPESEQTQGLEKLVTDPERELQTLHTMKSALLQGDVATLETLTADEFRNSPVSRKLLLDDRNARMAAAVERYLKGSEPCFVVVGAAHLIGKEGVVSRLAAKGFTVKRVSSAN